MVLDEQTLTRRLYIAAAAILVLSALLLTPTLQQVAEVFAKDKPGLWGKSAWYVFLMFSYGGVVLALSVNLILFIFGAAGEATCKRHTLLLVGMILVRGLFYSSITPPWQSPDEHAHFEYAALLAQLKRVPTQDDLSPELQERIVMSMFNYDFWRLIKRQPVESPPVGFLHQQGITYDPPTHVIDNRYLYYPQVGKDPPLYYIAPAIAYLICPQSDAALQLHVMRITTVLTLVTLAIAIMWVTQRLFYDDILLAMGISTLVTFHPMLAHMGSVLNNDILAAVLTTTLLGILVVILRSGLDWRRGLILAGLSLLGLLTKQSTIWTIPLMVGMGLVYGSRVNVWMRYVMLAIGIGALALLASLFIPSKQARYWTAASPTWKTTATHISSMDGSRVLRVAGETSEGVLEQSLLSQPTLDLRGHAITLTAQVRTDSEERQGKLAIVDLDHATSTKVEFVAGPEWQNIALQFVIPDDAIHLQVKLISAPWSVIYFDQVTIVDSLAPNVPMEWLRNGSGEQVHTVGEIAAIGLGQRLKLPKTIQRFFSLWQDNLKKLVSNPQPIKRGFQSFWGNFGAALVIPLPTLVHKILSFVCGIGVVGIGVYVYRTLTGKKKVHRVWQQYSFMTLGAALLLASFEVLMPLLAMYGLWAPQGRYLFPVILPIGTFLVLGWAQLMPFDHKHKWLLIVLTFGMIMLDYTALRLLANYFYNI